MDSALIGVLGTLLGVLTGSWVTYRFALQLAENRHFNEIALAFRAAFAEELTLLTTSTEDTYDILKKNESKHVAAGYQFRWVLSEEEKAAFDQAWVKFYQNEHDPRHPGLEKYNRYVSDTDSGIPKDDRRREAIKRIEALIQVARVK